MITEREYNWGDYDVAEPKDGQLDQLRLYNVAGIMNSRPQYMSFPSGKTMQRISLLTPKRSILVIEIWNSSKIMEPKFLQKWDDFPFCFCRNASYHGTTNIDDHKIHVFRISEKKPPNQIYLALI